MRAPRTIHVVDPDHRTRVALMKRLATAGHEVRTFASVAEYLRTRAERSDCILAAISSQDHQTIALSRVEQGEMARSPIVYLARDANMALAVDAMKAGAFDFVCTPLDDDALEALLAQAITVADKWLEEDRLRVRARMLLRRLTPRESVIFARILRGERNKQIAAALDSQEATVKVHRSRLMRKLEVRTLADLLHIGSEVEALLPEQPASPPAVPAGARSGTHATAGPAPVDPALHRMHAEVPRRVARPSRWAALYSA